MTAPSRRDRLEATPLYLVVTLEGAAEAERPGPAGAPEGVAAAVPAVVAAARGGARLFQVRLKGQLEGKPGVPLSARPTVHCDSVVGDARKPARFLDLRRALLRELRAALPADALLIVNDDLEAVFDEHGRPLADGVHLGREDAAALASLESGGAEVEACRQGLAIARSRLGPELLLGTSTRTLEEVLAAREAGCDYVGFGAMAPTGTKSDTTLASADELRRCLAAVPDAALPIFPIGGLGPHNLDLVLSAGCRRAAIGSAILNAADPSAVTREILSRLSGR
ncbi:MAG: thiamine phosphate synthase [Planctomycetota bacterium]